MAKRKALTRRIKEAITEVGLHPKDFINASENTITTIYGVITCDPDFENPKLERNDTPLHPDKT